jgi:hypothetical protein
MHAPVAAETRTSWRHPQGDARSYFNSERAGQWIEDWNKQGNMDSLNRLLEHARPLICSIVEYRATTKHEELDEIVQQIQIKLWRSLRLFDPSRGTSFSFVARVVSSTSASIVGECWKRSERFLNTTDSVLFSVPAREGNCYAIDDLEHKIRRIKTTCREPSEVEAQKWLVLSFIDAGFRLRRHEVSDAAMIAFGLSHSRSRQLHDLTLLEIRRELLAERRLAPISPADLAGTKTAALKRYGRYLKPEEFTTLAYLLKDLAPATIFLMRPENGPKILRGDSAAALENLGLILNGDPDAKPLFAA